MAELVEKVYASALFEAAEEENVLEEIRGQLEALNGIFSADFQYLRLLSSPAVTEEEKHSLLKESLEGRIHTLLYHFLLILSDKGRTERFPAITEEFEALYRKKMGLLGVEAVTAVALSDVQKEKLRLKLSALTGKTVLLQNTVDPKTLGGVILRYSNREIDGSVRERLNGLRKSLKGVIA